MRWRQLQDHGRQAEEGWQEEADQLQDHGRQAEEGWQEEADLRIRRQRPRVSEGSTLAALERRVAALEGQVRLGPVDAAPELEAERLLSAVLADIALLSA